MMASLGNFKTHGGNSDDRGNPRFQKYECWRCLGVAQFRALHESEGLKFWNEPGPAFLYY